MAEKKVKIEVTNAIVDDKKHGEKLEVSESRAKHLEAIGYAKIVGESKPKPKAEETKKDEKPKTDSKAKSETKAKSDSKSKKKK